MIASRWFSSIKKTTGIELRKADLRIASLLNPDAKHTDLFRFRCITLAEHSQLPDTISPTPCALVLPYPSVNMNYIEVPNVPDHELLQLVGYELANHIDAPIRDVTYDFTRSGYMATNDSKRRLIAFSCHKPVVEAALNRLQSISVTPNVVDSTVTALTNLVLAIVPSTKTQSCLAVCEHDDYALILVLGNGSLVFSRLIPRHRSESNDPLAEFNNPAEDLALEVNRTLEYCQMHFRDYRPEQLYLLGNENHAHLLDYLHESVSFPVSSIPLREKLQIMDTPMADEETICDYAVAMGGALRLARHGS